MDTMSNYLVLNLNYGIRCLHNVDISFFYKIRDLKSSICFTSYQHMKNRLLFCFLLNYKKWKSEISTNIMVLGPQFV